MAEHFEIDVSSEPDLPTISRVVELRKGRAELEAFIASRLAGLQPDGTLQWLYSLPWRAIFTTNYDGVIERAFELNTEPARTPVVMSASAEVVQFDPRYDVPIYHLHGSLQSEGPILITDADYALFYEKRRMLFETLRRELATSSILYVGYSHRDPNWKMVDAELRAEYGPSTPPRSYRVVPETDPLQKELLEAQGIEAIDLGISEFVQELRSAVGDIRLDATGLERLAAEVPGDLSEDFRKAPVAVARLLRGWTYVNQAPFNEQPNIREFLAGDRPNWALVGAGIPFERDIEGSAFDGLLDFATSGDEQPRSAIVLGSAGYGVTTVLMRLAARLAEEGAGRVFFHRAGMSINEGDIVFAAQEASTPPFFVIDNAADESDRVRNVIASLRTAGVAAYFVLGERLNQWMQRAGRFSPIEFGILALSDAEIERLLEYLRENEGLGQLAELNSELQTAAIKEKHEQQLLVAMREATEGRAFDAITEDEYHGIKGEFARRVYAAVCAFYRLRTLMRDSVLADVVERSISGVYEGIGTELEGVVRFEELDPAMGTYAARARHHTIAAIVWERVVPPGERELLLLKAVEALNLNYQVDLHAFDSLLRSDTTVDGLETLEGKIRFFESAAQKDPRSPYVRQHYARMLLREDKPELALGEVERALTLDETKRSVHHTKGVILKDLAMKTPSQDIARRRMVQSETEFRENINRDNRDDYSYQTLAELYVGWADRAESEDEALSYIAKAEEVVTEGLKHVRNRDALHIVSATIQNTLGNKPETLEALRRAVAAAPGGVVARYLLARELRRSGNAAEAAEILRGVLEGHPDEVRSAIQYARALDDLGRLYSESIAALKLANLYGFRDPRFITLLGGMLFLNGDFTEAEAVFRETNRRNFSFAERAAIHYQPRARTEGRPRLRLNGEVGLVKPGYVFIKVPGYPDVFCPGARFGNLVMRSGLRVTFMLAFTARGAMAEGPTLTPVE